MQHEELDKLRKLNCVENKNYFKKTEIVYNKDGEFG